MFILAAGAFSNLTFLRSYSIDAIISGIGILLEVSTKSKPFSSACFSEVDNCLEE